MRYVHTGGFWLVTGAAIIWGTIGIATQAIYNLDSTTPLFINLARTVIAAPVLLLVGRYTVGRTMFAIRRRDLLVMLLSGTFLALSQIAYFESIRYVGVTVATLLTLCIPPLIVTVFSVVFRSETLTRQMVFAMLCALTGSIMLVGLNTPDGTARDLRPGTLYALVAAACYAGMLICGHFLAAGYHPLQVTATGFAAGMLVLVPVNLANGIVTVQTAQGWMLVVYLGLIPTALAYWLFQMGLRSVPATTASIVIMLDPLVAAMLAWGLFGEVLTATGIVGGVLLLLSLFLLPAREAARTESI